jgi:hypothetical protein
LKSFSKPKGTEERFQKWIQYVDQNRFMNDAVETGFGGHVGSHADANWYTWQFTRLWWAYCWDWSHRKSLPGSSVKRDISNDFYDIEPVLYLLQADGLLTNDQKLQVPLAKAAFPKKDLFVVDTSVNDSRKVQDVFDNIVNIVPQSYGTG